MLFQSLFRSLFESQFNQRHVKSIFRGRPPCGSGVGGAPVPQVSLQSGDLPSGLQLSSAGQLTGTPNANGTYNFVLQASNGVGTAVLPVTIKIR